MQRVRFVSTRDIFRRSRAPPRAARAATHRHASRIRKDRETNRPANEPTGMGVRVPLALASNRRRAPRRLVAGPFSGTSARMQRAGTGRRLRLGVRGLERRHAARQDVTVASLTSGPKKTPATTRPTRRVRRTLSGSAGLRLPPPEPRRRVREGDVRARRWELAHERAVLEAHGPVECVARPTVPQRATASQEPGRRLPATPPRKPACRPGPSPRPEPRHPGKPPSRPWPAAGDIFTANDDDTRALRARHTDETDPRG